MASAQHACLQRYMVMSAGSVNNACTNLHGFDMSIELPVTPVQRLTSARQTGKHPVRLLPPCPSPLPLPTITKLSQYHRHQVQQLLQLQQQKKKKKKKVWCQQQA